MQFKKKILPSQHFLMISFFCCSSAFLITFLMKSLKLNPQKKHSALISRKAPSFKALKLTKNIEKKTYLDSKNYEGKPFILHFWASWCSSCYADNHLLNELSSELKKMGITLIDIAVSDDYESASAYSKKYKKTALIGIDTSGNIALDYGITGIPETFFVNEKGIITDRHTGPLDQSIFAKFFAQVKTKATS